MPGAAPESFQARLDRGPLLADGAMGTMLYARGVPFDQCFDALNVDRPDLVTAILGEYIAAGAELIETNTFGANRFKLSLHGLEDRVRATNVAGGGGRRPRPGGAPPRGRAACAAQANALAEGGVDLLIFETFSDLHELTEGVAAAKEVTGLPIIAQMTFTHEGKTLLGHTPAEIVARLEELGVAVIGANCSVGSQGVLEVMEQMVLVSRTPLSAMPNAGFPAYVSGRIIYFSAPQYMADYARQMVELGVTVVGGCCGTTPEHIQAMREVLRTVESPPPPRLRPRVTVPAPPRVPPPSPPPALAARLGRRFVLTVEVLPPRGTQEGPELEACQLLRQAGADTINVPDNPMARLRMSPWAMCLRIQTDVRMETVLHFTTRDRNLVRMQSDLLALHALGIRNILVLRGDPPQLGNYPSATAVSDVKPSGLIRLIKQFNEGRDLAGNDLGQATTFLVGAALNMGARDLDRELRGLEQKLRAGVDFLCTMPIFEPATLDRVLDRIGPLPVPLLVGILPLHGLRHAEVLHNEGPGMVIPSALRDAFRAAPRNGREVGLRFAGELVGAIRPRVQGLYLIPSFGRYDRVLHLVQTLRKETPAPTTPTPAPPVSKTSAPSAPRSSASTSCSAAWKVSPATPICGWPRTSWNTP